MSAERFSSFIMHIANHGSGGGHIYCAIKAGSLCGIEHRFLHDNFEQGVAEDEMTFDKWYALNQPWLCKTCVKAYAKLRDRPALDLARRHAEGVES